jgi:MarR family transcriptional regulator, organic hydroperoxide resistance regulator
MSLIRKVDTNMDQDKRVSTMADDMILTVPALYKWFLRSDGTGINTNLPIYNVLKFVKREGPISMSAIAQALYYSKQNLTHIVDQLVKEGHVERIPEPSDRRVLNIAITDRGRTFIAENSETLKNRLVEDLSHLSEGDAEKLSKAFKVVKEVLPKVLHHERPG